MSIFTDSGHIIIGYISSEGVGVGVQFFIVKRGGGGSHYSLESGVIWFEPLNK